MNSLAEIARFLKTTPQAVSNWKSRDQIPYHIVNQIQKQNIVNQPIKNQKNFDFQKDDSIKLSDLFVIMAEQSKVIFLTTFFIIFISLTNVQFIQKPIFESNAILVIPKSGGVSGAMGGLAGLASQFGVNIPSETTADLSNPSLIPDLLKSRTFAEIILKKEFFTKEYNKMLPMLNILTVGDKEIVAGRDTLIAEAVESLNRNFIEFVEDKQSSISVLKVHTNEPQFSKDLADEVLLEMQALNRFFKSESVNNKIRFIENRISSVQDELQRSEQSLKSFNERNRQIFSPSLQLELERLEREVEIQKGIYLTLKQQFELAKIEEVQESSIIQILDKPRVSFKPINKKLIPTFFVASFFGLGFGVLLAFLRAYFYNEDINERKKIRKSKHFFKKKTKEMFYDKKILFSIFITLLVASPFYFGAKSENPNHFGFYSTNQTLVNFIYLIFLVLSGTRLLKVIIKKDE